MEHRWGERLQVTLPVRIRAACGLVGTGLVTNFSVSGAFIATNLPVTVLSQVRVSFVAGQRHEARALRTRGTSFDAQVVRQNSAGFAVEWCEFGADAMVDFANLNRHSVAIAHRRATSRASILLGAKHP
jgi:hypothetical protein